MQEIASTINRVAHGLMHFSSVQAHVRLYRACAIHRADYLARAVPPSIFCPAVKPLDQCVIDNFAQVQMATSLHSLWAHLVRLPPRLGLTKAEFTAPLAYLSAAADAMRGWCNRRAGALAKSDLIDFLPGEEARGIIESFLVRVDLCRDIQPDFHTALLDDTTSFFFRTVLLGTLVPANQTSRPACHWWPMTLITAWRSCRFAPPQ